VSFRRLTSALVDRIEVIIRFLAVLELYKQGVVEIDQFERFGDLTLRWVGDDDYDPLHTSIDAYEG
jgi:segregation and condensation protein A